MTQEVIDRVVTAIDIPDRIFFTPRQAAEILQISEDMIWDYIKKYKILFAVRLIYQYRIPRVALEHFIRKGMECVLEDSDRQDMEGLNLNELMPDKRSYNKQELARILQVTERSLNNYITEGYLAENDEHRIDRMSIIHFLETMK